MIWACVACASSHGMSVRPCHFYVSLHGCSTLPPLFYSFFLPFSLPLFFPPFLPSWCVSTYIVAPVALHDGPFVGAPREKPAIQMGTGHRAGIEQKYRIRKETSLVSIHILPCFSLTAPGPHSTYHSYTTHAMHQMQNAHSTHNPPHFQ